ncbi:MAG TPA: MarR family transcriptional regulator [Streptosporangiaceae bacterium]|nr:MarR family transcriptional regulator [Streptosporangiaceae bacterium]
MAGPMMASSWVAGTEMAGTARPAPVRASRGQLGNDAWEALLSAHAVLMKQFAAEDIWADASMREYDVLYTLSKCPAPVRISELNRHVLLSQPALSRLVHRLAERGLVECQRDPDDGRAISVSLTDAGRALQRQIGRRHARSVARAMSAGLSRAELAQLQAICLKLAGQVAGPPASPPDVTQETDR